MEKTYIEMERKTDQDNLPDSDIVEDENEVEFEVDENEVEFEEYNELGENEVECEVDENEVEFEKYNEIGENEVDFEEVKLEASEDNKKIGEENQSEGHDISKMTMAEKKAFWENNFIVLQNNIMNIETIPKRKRTKEQRDELNALKRKYHRKRIKYPHLLIILRDQKKALQGLIKTKNNPKPKKEQPACFGSGTQSSPLVKFYFTSPCPQLGKRY